MDSSIVNDKRSERELKKAPGLHAKSHDHASLAL